MTKRGKKGAPRTLLAPRTPAFSNDQADITVEGAPVLALKVLLVGRAYGVYPFQVGGVMDLLQSAQGLDLDKIDVAKATGPFRNMLDTWIKDAFGAQADEVAARLRDRSDPLDYTHIAALLTKVMEASSGANPTT